MLFLQFQLDKDRYVVDCAKLVEVLPLVNIKRIPKAPEGVLGAFNFRSVSVPVVDLSLLTTGQAANWVMSTRILIVQYPDVNGEPQLLGLIAERAIETLRKEVTDFDSSGVSDAKTPYLGPVLRDVSGLIQWIDPTKLLTDAVRDVLFKQPRKRASKAYKQAAEANFD